MNGVINHSWSDLPVAILNTIAERLLYVEQIRFRLVCKSWRSNTNPIKHASNKLPWVMSIDNLNYDGFYDKIHPGCSNHEIRRSRSSTSTFFLYEPSQKKKYTLHNKILSGATIHASKHGWLLLYTKPQPRKPGSFVFYSPFTNKIIQLPKLRTRYAHTEATFSTPPTSSDCLIFVPIVSHKKLNLLTCSPGDKTWRNLLIDHYYGEVRSLAYVGGVFYCLLSFYVMGSFKVDKEEWRIHPVPIIDDKRTFDAKNIWVDRGRLIESHDGSLLVTYRRFGCPRQVFQFDQLEMKWPEVEHLGDKMLFLGVTSMLLPAVEEASELANTIHLALAGCATLARDFWDNFDMWSFYFRGKHRGLFNIYDWIDKRDTMKIWIQPINLI